MTDLEKKANIKDKQRFYEDARATMLEAMRKADEAELLAKVQREHANKMAERMNQRHRDLQHAMR